MPTIAPRIDPRLLAALERLDDPRIPIAETNRRIGAHATALGLKRPSYEQVRTIVHRRRNQPSGPTPPRTLLDVSLRAKPAEAIYAHASPLAARDAA
jgi:hypothetical protein